MAKAPVPNVFPGDFFLLLWDRDRESFVLELDDEAQSSHDLGGDPMVVVQILEMRGFDRSFRETAVDYAREFGAAQCVPSTNRVIQLLPRTVKKDLVFQHFEERLPHDWLPGLR